MSDGPVTQIVADPAPAGKPGAAPPTTPILGKFADQAALEAAYVALEAKIGTTPAAAPGAPVVPVAPVPGAPVVPVVPVAPVAPAVPLTVTQTPGQIAVAAAEKEFAETGKLADTTYVILQANGMDKNVVDNYIAGRKASADAESLSIMNSIGGEAQYNKLLQWAGSNLAAGDIAAFNEQVSGDAEGAKLAVQGLHARMAAASAQHPANPVEGDQPGAPAGVAPCENDFQVQQAMDDPRYKVDEAYRKNVENRIAVMMKAAGEL